MVDIWVSGRTGESASLAYKSISWFFLVICDTHRERIRPRVILLGVWTMFWKVRAIGSALEEVTHGLIDASLQIFQNSWNTKEVRRIKLYSHLHMTTKLS